jgi:GT2 family glycosyltransferase
MSDQAPDPVLRLVAERETARANRDFARADDVRTQIRDLGWEVSDGPSGTSLRPALPATPAGEVGYARPEDLASVLDEPAAVTAGLLLVAEDDPGDLERFLRGLAATPPLVSWELTVVANGASFNVAAILAEVDLEIVPAILTTSARLGWADAVNLGLRRSHAEVTVLVDTSLEPTGDFLDGLLAAFEDPSVGVAGPWRLLASRRCAPRSCSRGLRSGRSGIDGRAGRRRAGPRAEPPGSRPRRHPLPRAAPRRTGDHRPR